MRLLFVAFLLIAAPAFARDPSKGFREAANAIPEALIKQGYTQIGDLDVARLQKQIANVQVKQVATIDHLEVVEGLPQDRISAEWSNSEIHYNPKLWAQTSELTRAVLGLHENLGIAGFNDQKYQLSTGLWILSASGNPMTPAERGVFAGSLKDLAKSGGGIVGVGGGGDGDGLQSKLGILASEVLALKTASNRSEQVKEIVWYLDMSVSIEHDAATPCRYFLGLSSQMQQAIFEKAQDRFRSLDQMKSVCEKRAQHE